MKDRVQPSPNNQSKGALREWSGNSEHSAIGSNYQILSTPVQHRCSDFRPWSGNSEHSAIGSNYQILSTPVQHRCSDFRPCCKTYSLSAVTAAARIQRSAELCFRLFVRASGATLEARFAL